MNVTRVQSSTTRGMAMRAHLAGKPTVFEYLIQGFEFFKKKVGRSCSFV